MAKRSLVNIAPTQTNYEDVDDVEEAEPLPKKKCEAGLNCDNIESIDHLEDVEQKQFLSTIAMDSKPHVTADLSMISTPNDMPSDVYKFMVKNALTRQRSKLMEAGKFFYPKEFVKIDRVFIDQNKIKCFKKGEKNFFLKNVTAELNQSLWIPEKIYCYQSTDAMIRLLPKTALWNLQYIEIIQQLMSYENFKFLTSCGSIKSIRMEDAQIQYNDTKEEVPLEMIFELLPNCSELTFEGNAPPISSLEAANANRPFGLDSIYMYYLDEKSDFKTFSTFMINNQDITYCITFKYGISEDYVKEMKSIIVKINEAWNDQDDLPYIHFY